MAKRTRAQIDAEIAKYTEQFKAQQVVPKKVLLKCKPGTVLEFKWKDSPNSFGILGEKIDPKERGDVSIIAYDNGGQVVYPDTGQVVRIGRTLQIDASLM
jgi:hypothetical protein